MRKVSKFLTDPRRPLNIVVKKTTAGIKARGGLFPAEQDYNATADHVLDDPREPRMVATGVYDASGEMLIRVTMPIKQRMGFATPGWQNEEGDEVEMVIAANMLNVSDGGHGCGHVSPDELEDYEEFECDEEAYHV